MPFRFTRLEIPDLVLVEPTTHPDERGFFRETFKQSAFASSGITGPFVQENYSFSGRGVLRGLHYQKHPQAQGKLVSVLQGEVLDVAVDIRRGSPTYGRWVSLILSAASGCMIYVPPGFAHGFCVRSEQAGLLYKVTAEYAPELERGIVWNDPQVCIDWGIAQPLLSPRDARLPRLQDSDNDFVYQA